MDQQRFDDLTRQLITVPRRVAVGGALAAGVTALAATLSETDARKRRKKKKPCPAGHEKCGNLCCSPDRECVAGVGCQCKVSYAGVCCPIGQTCVNANLNACGCGQCPAGCACLAALGGTQLCVVSSCEDAVVRPCGSVYDCPAGTACFSECNGRFCMRLCGT